MCISLFIVLHIVWIGNGLSSIILPKNCTKIERSTITAKVTIYRIETRYTSCGLFSWARCSVYRAKLMTKLGYKLQVEEKQICCDGLRELNKTACIEDCSFGFYGPSCSGICRCHYNSTCDPDDGSCNCTSTNSTNEFCQEVSSADSIRGDNTLTVVLSVTIVTGVFVGVFSLIFSMFWMKRKQQTIQRHDDIGQNNYENTEGRAIAFSNHIYDGLQDDALSTQSSGKDHSASKLSADYHEYATVLKVSKEKTSLEELPKNTDGH